MSEVAVMVLAAFAPGCLAATSCHYIKSNLELFVHLDSRVDLSAYRELAGLPEEAFISERHKVYWAGFSMIDATVALASNALQNSDANYFCLTSDDTVPILGADKIAEVLGSSQNSWIETWPVPYSHPFSKRYTEFYYLDSDFTTPRWLHTEDRSIAESDLSALSDLQEIRGIGKFPLEQLYSGKQWWIMTREDLEAVLRIHFEWHHFRNSFRFSAVPDETYFQTIFRLLFPDRLSYGNPMLDDFSRVPKPFLFSELAEFSQFLHRNDGAKKFLFARKVSANIAEALLGGGG